MRRAVGLLVAAAVLAGSGCGAVAVHQGGASDTRTSSPSAPAASLAASPQGSPVPCATPPNRVLGGMAYMSNLGEAVLFGGQGILGNSWVLADTWTWRSGCWTQRHPAHSPPAYRSASMAFDETAGRVIAYLGDGDPGQEQATWSWDGSDWTRVADGPTTFWAGAPDSAIAYDASIGRVVLYGLVAQAGANCWVASTQCSPQTWTWNGTTWQTMNPRHSPPPRLYSNMAYDPTTGRVLLFGGHSIPDTPNHYLGDTWGWDGSDWTQLSPAHIPPPRQSPALVTYAARSRVLMVGGAEEGELSDAWAWDGHDWTPIPSPGPREGAASADVGSKIILFGGTLGPGQNTLAWDGQTWSSS
jgi:hypothetical protein